jgi:hypothetical protein
MPLWALVYAASLAAVCLAAGGPLVLSETTILVFRAEEFAACGQGPCPPALACDGPDCDAAHVREVVCVNTRLKDGDTGGAVWDCSAVLDPAYALESTEIRCEGWESDEDLEVVVDGSCHLVYTLCRVSWFFGDLFTGGFTLLEVCLFFAVLLVSCM